MRRVIEATLQDEVVPETPWNLAELDTVQKRAFYGRLYENHRGIFWVLPLDEVPLLMDKLHKEGPIREQIKRFERETEGIPDSELWTYCSMVYPEIPVLKPLVDIAEYAVAHAGEMRRRKRQDLVFAQLF